MSTTFGIYVPQVDDGVEVAYRTNSNISILNPLIYLLPPETVVIPLDNTAQGIYTVKDLLKENTYHIDENKA